VNIEVATLTRYRLLTYMTALLALWSSATVAANAAASTITLTVVGCGSDKRALQLESRRIDSGDANDLKMNTVPFELVSAHFADLTVRFSLAAGNYLFKIDKGDCFTYGGLRVLGGPAPDKRLTE